MITASAAIDDPGLLGSAFAGASWSTWRAVLRAAEGLPLNRHQRRAFRAVAEREPPTKRVRELWAIVGRRGGKDSLASAIAIAAALGDYRALLRPGERATVMCLACDRAQARIVHRYISGYFQSNPLLAPLVERETDETIELSNGVEIIVSTNSFRTVRGRTIICAVFDETAFWKNEASATPDFETYNAVAPGLITLPNAMLIGISTPYRRSGLLFDRWRRFYGKPDPDVLVVKGPSTAFNPLLPQSIIDQALERDPEAAAAEWLAEWRSDLADFVSREVVDGVVVAGRYEIPPIADVRYAAFCDPSGGSSDSMTLAIGHTERDLAILDCVREVRAPFPPANVVAEFAAVLKRYGCAMVTGDRYAGVWPDERFAEHSIQYIAAEHPKSDIYREFLPVLNGGRCELLDHPRLTAQLCNLERRTARGGRDSIDHPPGAHDDISNAVAGVLVGLAGGDAPVRCRGTWLLARREHEARLVAAGAAQKRSEITYAPGSLEWQRQQDEARAVALVATPAPGYQKTAPNSMPVSTQSPTAASVFAVGSVEHAAAMAAGKTGPVPVLAPAVPVTPPLQSDCQEWLEAQRAIALQEVDRVLGAADPPR